RARRDREVRAVSQRRRRRHVIRIASRSRETLAMIRPMRLALVLVVAGCYHEPHVGSGDDAPPPIDAPRDTTSATCPAAYSIHGQTARYRFTAASGTYPQVVADCKSDGGHLAKIVDAVEDAFIDSAFSAASPP